MTPAGGWWPFAQRWLLRAWWVGVTLGLMGVAFAISFVIAMRSEMRSTEVRVPPLVGLALDDARRAVEPMALVLEIADRRNDPRVPSGRVIEQTPPADAAVRRGRKIKLVVSLGGRVLAVPALVGRQARAVSIELRQEGFVPGFEARVPSREVPPGQVLSQEPAAGVSAVPNSRVHRLVSDGSPAPRFVMPDLRGLPRAEAERWVTSAGFRLGTIRTAPRRRGLPGTVVAHDPPSGYPVRSRGVVGLTIAD